MIVEKNEIFASTSRMTFITFQLTLAFETRSRFSVAIYEISSFEQVFPFVALLHLLQLAQHAWLAWQLINLHLQEHLLQTTLLSLNFSFAPGETFMIFIPALW